jgi:PhnB protein
MKAGCKSTMEPQDTFWEARFAMLIDPFGHRWMLNAPLPKKKKPAARKK